MDARNCRVAWKSHSTEITSILLKFRDETKYTDATIMCSGYKYPVHKVILASSSKYFEELLHQMEDLHPVVHPVIVLNNIDKIGLEAILKFIYMGEVSIQEKDVVQLFDAARELKIKGLCDDALRSVCLSKQDQNSVIDKILTDPINCEESTLESESVDTAKKRKLDTRSPVNLRTNRKRRRKMYGNDYYENSEILSNTASGNIITGLGFTAVEATSKDIIVPSISVDETLHCDIDAESNDGELNEAENDLIANDEHPVDVKEEFIEESCSLNTETIFLPFQDEAEGVSSVKSEIESPEDQEISDHHNTVSELPSQDWDEMVADEFESPRINGDDPHCISSAPVQDPSLPTALQGPTFDESSAISVESLPDFLKAFKVYKFSPYLQGRLKEKYWEQNGILRLMKGIRDHEITLKEASNLLGTTYSVLYRHYSINFGGIKKLSKEAEPSLVKNTSGDHKEVNPKTFVKVRFLQCPQCIYKSPYKQNILEHLCSHLTNSASPSSKDLPKLGEFSKSDSATQDNLLTCDICSAKFAHLRTLRRHKQGHLEASV
ncbi:protein jim lovell-like [Macrobrachium nipponense]|uniref:protein jim lovell-like n=1 Tax=Macrobrachium nipponense TaxID=159736 RepID=UPI0030C80DB8